MVMKTRQRMGPERLMALALACGMALGVAGWIVGSTAARAAETVVFAGWGGSIQENQRKIFFAPFEKATGIKVIDVPGVDLAKIKAMVEAKNVEWDVTQPIGMWIPRGEREGLWEELDYRVIQRDGVPTDLAQKHAFANSTYGMILAYNTKAFPPGKEPQSWADFWNTEKFPGPRGMFDQPRYMLEIALMADGVAPGNLYPIDVDRAFKKLDQIKPKIHVWWKQWPQVPTLLGSGEIVMSLTSNTRITSVKKTENAPAEINWKQGMMTVDWLAVPKGAKNKANAMKLINFMNKPELQAELARAAGIGPANAKALDLLSSADRENMPAYHFQKGNMVRFGDAWWAENLSKMEERWNAWKLK
jgi:putative spermidine/putrescine transport system substrate-binding protein